MTPGCSSLKVYVSCYSHEYVCIIILGKQPHTLGLILALNTGIARAKYRRGYHRKASWSYLALACELWPFPNLISKNKNHVFLDTRIYADMCLALYQLCIR